MNAILLNLIISVSIVAITCTTKVSEWVLLNTEPEPYLLVYFHKDQVSEKVRQHNSAIAGALKDANARFRTSAKEDALTPYYTLFYRDMPVADYSGPEDLAGLSSSPLRSKIAGDIMAGKLCTMLYLNSGNKALDEAGLATLKNAIGSSPFGSVISLAELNRNDKAERHFITMLLNVESDLNELNAPMLFGIFGRFRALEPLVGKGITGENIGLMIDFLTADCSCLIKDDLPGADILFTNEWDDPMPALVNRILDENPSLLHH